MSQRFALLELILDECSGYYQNVYGLPCALTMQHMQRALSFDDIHSQLLLDRPVILPLPTVTQLAKVINPIVLQGRGIPMG